MGWLCLSLYVCYICGCMCSSNCDFLQVPQHQNCEKWHLASCLSVRPYGTTRLPFTKFQVWVFFEYLLRKFKLHYNLTRIMIALHANQHTFFYHILLTPSQNEKCFRLKSLRKSEHTFYVQWHLSKNHAICEIVWKNTIAPDIPDNMELTQSTLDA